MLLQFKGKKDWTNVRKEQLNASRLTKQLKELIHGMEELRSKVSQRDLREFDKLTDPAKNDALRAIQEFQGSLFIEI